MDFDDPRRFSGKPYRRVIQRIEDNVDLNAMTDHFDGVELKAFYLAYAVESCACWPRVLNGTMAQERFHDRADRMRKAIVRAFNLEGL